MNVDYTTGEVTRVGLGPLATALAKAQTSFPTITRSKTVRVTTKTGGAYTFSYAPLDSILDAVRKPLADNGLAIAQLLDRDELVTILMHESGASLEGRATLPNSNDVQGYGSAITYLRRYAIQALLGIAAEEDDDGNGASGNSAQPAEKPARAPRAAQERTQPVVAQPSTTTPPQGELTDDDWGGIVTEPLGASLKAASDTLGLPDANGNGHATNLERLGTREFFDRIEAEGIDRKLVTATAKKMYGPDKWSVKDHLTDEERAGLYAELTA